MAESLHEDQLGWWEQHFFNTTVLNTAAFRIFPQPFRHLSGQCPCWRWCSVEADGHGRKNYITPLGTEPHFWGRVFWNHHQTTLPVKSRLWMHMVPLLCSWLPNLALSICFLIPLQPSFCRLIHMSPSYSQLAGGHLPWTMAVEPEDCQQQDTRKMFRNQTFQINPWDFFRKTTENRNFPSNLPKIFEASTSPGLFSPSPLGWWTQVPFPDGQDLAGERIQPYEGSQGFTR